MNFSSPFFRKIFDIFPELEPIYQEHILDYEEFLPHVFMGEFSRFFVEKVEDRRLSEAVSALLEFFEDRLCFGSEEEKEWVIVSFIENIINEKNAIEYILNTNVGPKMNEAIKNAIEM